MLLCSLKVLFTDGQAAVEVLETLLMLKRELYQRFQSPGVYFRIPQMMCLKQKQPPWKVFKTYAGQQEQRETTRGLGNVEVFTGANGVHLSLGLYGHNT